MINYYSSTFSLFIFPCDWWANANKTKLTDAAEWRAPISTDIMLLQLLKVPAIDKKKLLIKKKNKKTLSFFHYTTQEKTSLLLMS